MQTTTTTSSTSAARVPSIGAHPTLDTLAAMTFAELEALYRTLPAPALLDVAGDLRGRMLAMKNLERGPIGKALRRFAASPSFVWGGKTFAPRDAQHGVGHNRVSIPTVLGRQNLFPFETRLDRSELDTRPTLVLDYALAVNPPYIRKIHDEIRELAPGLWFGPAMWKTAKGPVTIVWFGLDGRAS
jgi:hypothetical protein